MSRTRGTRIFALIATVAALAVLLAGCGGGGSEDPQAVVEDATLAGVESGVLEAKMSIISSAKSGGKLDLTLSGPFQRGAVGLPQLALEVAASGEADGEPISFEGDLTMLSDRAFVGLRGTEYEVDPTTFGVVKSGFERAQQQGAEEEGKEGAGDTACKEAAKELGLDLGDFIEGLESESGVDVDGTSTSKVSGALDLSGTFDLLARLLEKPACKAQLEAAGGGLGLSELEKAQGEVANQLQKSHVELYVGDDDIVRKVVAELTVEPPQSGESVRMDLEATLSEVNQDQTIAAPKNAKPLQDLFRELGVNPLQLLEGFSGGGGGGLGGLGGLLEGLESGPSGESLEGLGEAGGDRQLEYVECLQNATSESDPQKCASLLQ